MCVRESEAHLVHGEALGGAGFSGAADVPDDGWASAVTAFVLIALAGGCSAMAAVLAVALVVAPRHMPMPRSALLGGTAMLVGLTHTVWQHVGLAALGPDSAPPWVYGAGLFAQSWGFYALLSGVLQPTDRKRPVLWASGLLSIGWAWWIPSSWAVPVSLAIGTGYSLHLGVLLYRLRATRRWFVVELPVVGAFALMGVAVGATGALAPQHVGWDAFALAYSWQIMLGYLLVTGLLLLVPDLAAKTQGSGREQLRTKRLGQGRRARRGRALAGPVRVGTPLSR